MADQKPSEHKTEPFPGSVTGNKSGAPKPGEHDEKAAKKDPAAPFPGSPSGNASGVGEAKKP